MTSLRRKKIIVELDNYLDRLAQVKEKQRNAASFLCAKLNFGLNLLICGGEKSSSKLEIKQQLHLISPQGVGVEIKDVKY